MARSRYWNSIWVLDELLFVVLVYVRLSVQLLDVVVVDEWLSVHLADVDYIVRIGTCLVHLFHHRSLHKHHVAIPNTDRRKW